MAVDFNPASGMTAHLSVAPHSGFLSETAAIDLQPSHVSAGTLVDRTDDAPVDLPTAMNLFGYRLHPMTGDEVIGQVSNAVRHRRRLIMANLNVHGMAMMYESAGMTRLLTQPDSMVMIDGMPVLFMANMLRKARLPRNKRATSLDFYDELFATGIKAGWQFAYVGSTPQVLNDGIAVLRERFPALKIEGRDGYFDMHDTAPGSKHGEIIGWLQALSPDVVIVGMGMPRQEEWIELVQSQVDARVFLSAGAYLDYQVGVQKAAPRWMGRYGVEWVYRLAASPHRLSYRYLLEPMALAFKILTKRPLPDIRRDSLDTAGKME